MGKSWTTDEQRAWLRARCSDFLKARLEGELEVFHRKLSRDWFEIWPERTVSNPPVVLTPEEMDTVQHRIKTKKKVSCHWPGALPC